MVYNNKCSKELLQEITEELHETKGEMKDEYKCIKDIFGLAATNVINLRIKKFNIMYERE